MGRRGGRLLSVMPGRLLSGPFPRVVVAHPSDPGGFRIRHGRRLPGVYQLRGGEPALFCWKSSCRVPGPPLSRGPPPPPLKALASEWAGRTCPLTHGPCHRELLPRPHCPHTGGLRPAGPTRGPGHGSGQAAGGFPEDPGLLVCPPGAECTLPDPRAPPPPSFSLLQLGQGLRLLTSPQISP